MRLAALGVGGTGCRVVDALRAAESERGSYLTGVSAFDTDASTLTALSLSDDRRVAFGGTELGGAGTGGDRTLGREAALADEGALVHAVEETVTDRTDAVVLVAGVGGGTGSGATPVLARALADRHDVPIYALCVLPAGADPQSCRNAAAATDELREAVVAQLLFDDDARLTSRDAPPGERGDAAAATRARLNDDIVAGVEGLFAAGEIETSGEPTSRGPDPAAIAASLEAGGYATIGAAAETVRSPPSVLDRLLWETPWSFLDRFSAVGDDVDRLDAIKTLETTTRRAVLDRRWMANDGSEPARVLVVFEGPPAMLDGRAVTNATSWIESTFDDASVRAVAAPSRYGTDVTVAVLEAGIDRPRRFDGSSRAVDRRTTEE